MIVHLLKTGRRSWVTGNPIHTLWAECLTRKGQESAVMDARFCITYLDSYWTEFLVYRVLPSACWNLQPPAQSLI